MTPRERYQIDIAFRFLVDTLHREIQQARYTPTEIREAALLAQILYEERRPVKLPESIDKAWLDKPREYPPPADAKEWTCLKCGRVWQMDVSYCKCAPLREW